MTVAQEEARGRIAAAQAGCAAAGFDALVVTPGAELRYLTGYAALSLERLTALVVPARGEAFVVVPRLEAAAARAAGVDGVVPMVDFADGEDAYALAVGRLSRELGGVPGVLAASDRLGAAQWFEFGRVVPGVELALASVVVSPMRMVKSDFEVGELARAGAAIDRVHARVPGWLRRGRSEAEVAADVAAAIVEEGHAGVEFVIVASGPNGASPHAAVTDRVLGEGDVVVVDIGGVVDSGYGSDCTRTYCVGEPPADFVAYYGVLREAQAAAVAAVRPGVSAQSVDAGCVDGCGFWGQFHSPYGPRDRFGWPRGTVHCGR
jgi:Xaa-Pro aminopeptidase